MNTAVMYTSHSSSWTDQVFSFLCKKSYLKPYLQDCFVLSDVSDGRRIHDGVLRYRSLFERFLREVSDELRIEVLLFSHVHGAHVLWKVINLNLDQRFPTFFCSRTPKQKKRNLAYTLWVVIGIFIENRNLLNNVHLDISQVGGTRTTKLGTADLDTSGLKTLMCLF